ncbi:putative ABC transporter ATP-binding protein [Clostridium tetani]|uniref:ABC transporter ATP-binding protein n=2 Tax=Clostridium tetani TaxID=1513 RepID=A0ABC8ECA1_CLOTA|nr:ABC transporter ATP-binding protein [Clostridium tetani]BDR66830.1 putative ABC transporter ATP-binding protein [Clostridium tetani]BDR72318.1 putative ABC transporter ATP-binding protein [Clostridium tetani]BDR80793.1 putative ABC transporter ATP-binding protein [Clostridium tetani]BDR89250.1 putative ABC transporter ATP-binding protein [Clostridium tetani]
MRRRKGIVIMASLIGFAKPLAFVMFVTITMGIIGSLASIFMTIYAGIGIGQIIGLNMGLDLKKIFIIIGALAISRGFLRYIEQYSGHYVAFKVLAIFRDKIFKKLRVLSPAKLEGKQKGELISIITSDIELLEVFYAHTIAPITIGFVTSLIMTIYIGRIHFILGIIAILAYFTIGFIIPYFSSKFAIEVGLDYRNSIGRMNSYMLDSLKGMKEIIMFNLGQDRLNNIDKQGNSINEKIEGIKRHEGIITSLTDVAVLIFTAITLFTAVHLLGKNIIEFKDVIIATVAIMSSFGPVIALSNLSNNLLQTLASGDRVLNLLEEEPAVKEVYNGCDVQPGDIEALNVSFSYNTKDTILENINIKFKKGNIVGIVGESGSGKSTLLKLFMRFWDITNGNIQINDENIRNTNTNSLRKIQSFVTQETFLFNDTIEENIRIGKKDATLNEIKEACKKASINEFIESLPKGYKTKVGELGENLSGGERQRLGLARAFLHNGDMILLDEPTSNLDSLNEKVIIKTLKNECRDKTVILVSHRMSTVAIADEIYTMKNKNLVKKESLKEAN